MPNIIYRKQSDGSYKKLIYTEKNIGGKLSFVDEYSSLKGEVGLTGSQGEKGDIGPMGLQGIPGEKGDIGPMGLQGIPGEKGEKGDKGPQGEKGDKGDKGPQGEKGDKGDKGHQGDKGDKGEKGLQGEKGEKGDKGEMGLQGIPGEKGEKGDKGDIGPRGFMGPIGPTGPQGATGPQGKKGDKGEKGDRGPMGMGARGIGISSTEIVNNYLIITYTDGTTQNAGYISGGTGSGTSSTSYSEVKTGVVTGASFSGVGKLYYDVVFDSAYTYNLYSISVIGDDVRTWSISGKTASGFRIESNSSEPLIGDIYWISSYGSGAIQSNNRRGIASTFTQNYLGVWKTSIVFTDPLSATYSISVTGDDPRTWSVENVSLTGFDINSNSSVALSGNAYWQCIEV